MRCALSAPADGPSVRPPAAGALPEHPKEAAPKKRAFCGLAFPRPVPSARGVFGPESETACRRGTGCSGVFHARPGFICALPCAGGSRFSGFRFRVWREFSARGQRPPRPTVGTPPALHASCGFWYIPPALSRASQTPEGPPVTVFSEFLEKINYFYKIIWLFVPAYDIISKNHVLLAKWPLLIQMPVTQNRFSASIRQALLLLSRDAAILCRQRPGPPLCRAFWPGTERVLWSRQR